MTCLHPTACRKSMSRDCKKYQLCNACANRARAAVPEQRSKLAEMAKAIGLTLIAEPLSPRARRRFGPTPNGARTI